MLQGRAAAGDRGIEQGAASACTAHAARTHALSGVAFVQDPD